LNLYARAEQAVGSALEAAHSAGATPQLRHLAGQRLADLITTVEAKGGTGKQMKAFGAALEAWKSVEPNRQFLAHGVASLSADSRENWTLLLDVVAYRKNARLPERWAIKQDEALDFLEKLEDAFKRLSGQLGHFRKRIAA
jgi:hypothetical protein